MKYTFYDDPGHGWLAVSLHELSELGIVDEITPYSYVSRDRQTVYLEEDCDLTTFCNAKFGADRKERMKEFWEKECHTDDSATIYPGRDSFVRNLDPYNLRAA